MDNLEACTSSNIEIKFEKLLIKWNKIAFIIFLLIEIVAFIASIINDHEEGIICLPLMIVTVVSYYVIRVIAEISLSLKLSNNDKK